MAAWRINGRVAEGLGQGAGFTGLDWVRDAFIEQVGIDPWPGTLNISIDVPNDLSTWSRVQTMQGVRLPAADPGACDARCYPVRVADRFPAVIVLPEVDNYPSDKLELVAAIGLRDALTLVEGDVLEVVSVRTTPIHTAIFDADGTLVDSVNAYHIAAGRAAEPFGYNVTRELVSEALNTRTPFWHLVLPESERGNEELIQNLRDATMRHWPDVLAEHVGPFEGLNETLEELQNAGISLGIYSGSQGESFAPLEESGLMEFFDVVLTANDVEEPKPHPEGVLSCMEKLDARPENTAYVGDVPADMQAAEAAGVLAVGVLTGSADSAALSRAGAHRLAAGHHRFAEIFGI